MRFYENIISDIDIKDLKVLLNKNYGIAGYYALCVSGTGRNLMEIISISNMLKSVNQYKNYGIIAVFKHKSDAMSKAAELIQKYIDEKGRIEGFKEYYNSRCK